MKPVVCITPRQAAYRDMGALLGQLRGRSRRAQRVLLEVELVRALERAYAFELRTRQLAARLAEHKGSPADASHADPDVRQSVETLRREIAVIVERCRRLERVCGLGVEVRAECAPASAPRRTGDADPDEAASTQRCPQTPWSRQAGR